MERFGRIDHPGLAPIDYPNIHASRRGNHGFFSLGRSLVYGLGALALVSIYAASASLAQQAKDQERAAWVSRSSLALENPDSLKPGQRYYKRVRVVGAGRDLGEKLDMESKRGWVNVRLGPDLRREIIGRVRVGGAVHNVVIDNNWAAVRCRDITDLEPVDQSTTPEMCAIHADYLMK